MWLSRFSLVFFSLDSFASSLLTSAAPALALLLLLLFFFIFFLSRYGSAFFLRLEAGPIFFFFSLFFVGVSCCAGVSWCTATSASCFLFFLIEFFVYSTRKEQKDVCFARAVCPIFLSFFPFDDSSEAPPSSNITLIEFLPPPLNLFNILLHAANSLSFSSECFFAFKYLVSNGMS